MRAGWPKAAWQATEDFSAGRISAPVALMRLALTGLPAAAIVTALEEDEGLA
ncbi:MAG: hypothetical protein JWR00_2704, partial [Rubritepida sp.]|nr:hypothetical protein [Rubritepida sp.]